MKGAIESFFSHKRLELFVVINLEQHATEWAGIVLARRQSQEKANQRRNKKS